MAVVMVEVEGGRWYEVRVVCSDNVTPSTSRRRDASGTVGLLCESLAPRWSQDPLPTKPLTRRADGDETTLPPKEMAWV
jgi:hypothetical protein